MWMVIVSTIISQTNKTEWTISLKCGKEWCGTLDWTRLNDQGTNRAIRSDFCVKVCGCSDRSLKMLSRHDCVFIVDNIKL